MPRMRYMKPAVRSAPGRKPSGPRLLTAEEFQKLYADEECELVEGKVFMMTFAGGIHGYIELILTGHLLRFVRRRRLGILTPGDVGYILRRNPDTVRAPDIGFVRRARVPRSGIPKSFWPFPPDLAVEIVSPNDRLSLVEAKAWDWISAGTREVWVVNPRTREVRVHSKGKAVRILDDRAVLKCRLLPGFSLKVSEIFTSRIV